MKKTVCTILITALLATLSGCSKKTQEPAPTMPKPTVSAKPLIEGDDVFGGKRFDQMLWGYYEAAAYDYTGDSAADTAEFLQDMYYVEVPSQYGKLQLSALPLDVQFGNYSQFMAAFSYEGKYYSAYTETGKAMFRKLYMEKFGELTAQSFQKLEDLLQLSVAQMTFVQPDGNTQLSTFAYEIKDDKLFFYTMAVDDTYNLTVGDVYAKYDFLYDGGQLILNCNGVRRAYLESGYKEADKDRLRVAGYAQDRSKQYENLEGFVLSAAQDGQGYEIDMVLNNGARPIDPEVTFDKTTGDFSVTWTGSDYYSGEIQHTDPRRISGKLIPCTSYGFVGYSGFYLLIDGVCYSYLVSEDEYKERKYANVENADLISDPLREKLSEIQIGILAELDQAYQLAEIPASVDFSRGQIVLEADRLFGTDSQQITQEGQDVLLRFLDIYASVILKETYSEYISHMVIEGHTDAGGDYSYEQTLSMNRADAVAKCFAEQFPNFGKDIQLAGCAYDYPVYNDDGSVNADESNRIILRFLLAEK